MPIINKKRVLYSLVAPAFLVGLIEILLRTVWGFGDMVLFREDENFEYITEPNQERFRFGNRIAYNEHSMRSDPIGESDSCIVLGFGDSVLNGGTLTDQDNLATSIAENELNKKIRVLNISSASWGPDNCAAYLKKVGHFNAKMIFLMVSSHDAYDNMTFERTVGHHGSYPDRQYAAATYELMARYIIPRVLDVIAPSAIAKYYQTDDLMINRSAKAFNPGFELLRTHAVEKNIPFVIFLHQEAGEINKRQYFPQGEEIVKYCKNNNVKLISGLEVGENASHLLDNIHLNKNGHKFWAEIITQTIQENLICVSSK
jgi:lysophospholipase L1-like esterase